jgi:hypothetical protein
LKSEIDEQFDRMLEEWNASHRGSKVNESDWFEESKTDRVYHWTWLKDKEEGSNPKTLTGKRKLPMLSVIPPTAIIYLGMAMKYGAYDAPKVDGTKGYGPYNWRDQPIEFMVYVDACLRHLLRLVDGHDVDPDSGKPELAHAMATLAILADAIENKTVIDDRPKVKRGVAANLLAREVITKEL